MANEALNQIAGGNPLEVEISNKEAMDAFLRNQGISRGVDAVLNGENCPEDQKKWAFAVVIYPMNGRDPGNVNFVQNAPIENMLMALRHLVALVDGSLRKGPTSCQ